MTSPAAPLYHRRPERWPQVSLKGSFVLVTFAGVFLGWLGVQLKCRTDHSHLAQMRHCIRLVDDWIVTSRAGDRHETLIARSEQ